MSVSYRIEAKSTALLVHDLFNDNMEKGGPLYDPKAEAVLPKVQRLIKACRELGVLIVFTGFGVKDQASWGRIADFYPEVSHGTILLAGSPGSQIHPSIAPQNGDIIVEKRRYSAFYATGLDDILRRRGIDTLVVCGDSLDVGCDIALKEATNRDYKAILVKDACIVRPISDQGWGDITPEEVERVCFSSLSRSWAMLITSEDLIAILRSVPKI